MTEPLATRTSKDFGAQVSEVTRERGADYGSRLGHFGCVGRMMSIWRQTRAQYFREGRVTPLEEDLEFALDHCVEWILDKLARAAASPAKPDHWVDVAGYAECFLASMEELSSAEDAPGEDAPGEDAPGENAPGENAPDPMAHFAGHG
jgi:hypothetical protein